MKKKLIYVFTIICILIFIISDIVYSEYILTNSFNVDIKTAPFYFNAVADTNEIKMRLKKASTNITIKNYDETDFNKFDTNYTIELKDNNKFSIVVQDDNQGKIIGNVKKDNSITVEIKANENAILENEENIVLLVKSILPYEKTIEIPLTIRQPSLVEGGRNDFRKVEYSDDTEGKPKEVYDQLYGGNNGKLEINPDGSIVLDEDNPVMVFNKSDKDYTKEYSLYITIKGDIDQVPKDLNGVDDRWGPATIFAMSGEQVNVTGNKVNRLCWVGFRNGCLQVYSYLGDTTPSDINDEFYDPTKYLGFISKKLPRKYDNQILNIQITANTNNTTEVYLNGDLFISFESGKGTGEFHEATIGDLRALRGVKFIGTFYDVSIYDRKLSEEEVKNNWEYAEDKWNIVIK